MRLLQIPKLPLEDPEASFADSESAREEIRQQLPLPRVLFLISFYAVSFSRVMDQTEVSGRRWPKDERSHNRLKSGRVSLEQ